jgi:actin-related protein
MAPIDVSALGREGRDLNNAWKEAIRKHNRHTTRNEYFKRREMDEWSKELQAINSKYRQLFKELIAKKKAEAAEQARKEKEEKERKEKEVAEAAARKAAQKAAKATKKAVTRSEKKAAPKSEKKRTRCPNGTRKNKKTGECEKK